MVLHESRDYGGGGYGGGGDGYGGGGDRSSLPQAISLQVFQFFLIFSSMSMDVQQLKRCDWTDMEVAVEVTTAEVVATAEAAAMAAEAEEIAMAAAEVRTVLRIRLPSCSKCKTNRICRRWRR